MSDSELSEFNDADDLVRQYENNDSNNDDDIVQESNKDGIDLEEVKNEDENVNNKGDSAITKKRVSRKLYVLNTDRLKGHKGIHTIEKLYEGFKFNGKGNESEDLNRVMKRLEYWAFRLFPKLDFDDFLGKCEHLGHKKDLHTHLKKYRLGMIDDQICTENEIIEDEKNDQVTMETKMKLITETINDDFQKLFDEIN